MKGVFISNKYFLISLLLVVVAISTGCFSSRRSVSLEEGWELLAERKVNFVTDKDEIEIKTRRRFTAIRFKVEDREVRLNELKIYFDNGDKLEPALDDVISAGQYSRIVELGREGRYLNKIEFRYRTTGNVLKGRANVLVIGQRYEPYRD